MTQTTTASHEPAIRPTAPKARNLLHRLSEPPITYSGCKQFDSKATKAQIRNFCREAIAQINQNCTVSLNIDEAGLHLNIISDQFTFTFIYQENKKTNGRN